MTCLDDTDRRGLSRARRSAPRRRGLDDRHHEAALLRAQVHCLQHALRPYGVLRRDALEHAAGAGKWPGGGFDSALRAAVEAGVIDELPFGFYGIRRVG